MNKEEKIANDPHYNQLVDAFIKRRLMNKASQREIEIATQTGGGRISNFEARTYKPTLLTFVKWCRAAGIRIKLTQGNKKNMKQIIDQINNPPEEDDLILQIQKDNLKNNKNKP